MEALARSMSPAVVNRIAFTDADDAEAVIPLIIVKKDYPAYRSRRLQTDPHCTFCGRELAEHTATLDHLIPRSRGGLNQPWNLVLACSDCNGSKSNKLLTEWRDEILQEIEKRQQFVERLLRLIATENRFPED